MPSANDLYRYQLMIRGQQMPKLSRYLATINEQVKMPEDVMLAVDIDPLSLA